MKGPRLKEAKETCRVNTMWEARSGSKPEKSLVGQLTSF